MCLILLLLLRQWFFFAGRGWQNFIWQRQWLWLSLGCLTWVLWWNSRIKLFWSQGGSLVGWLNEWINVYSFFVVSWHFVLFLFIQVFKNFMIFLCLRGVPHPIYLYFFLLRPYSFFLYISSSLHGITRFVANTTNVHFYHSFSYFLWLSEEIPETYSTIRGTPSRCCSHHWWLFQRRLYKILC